MGEMPVIDKEKCQGCGLCVSVCTCGGLEVVNGVVVVIEMVECDWCAMCEAVCPNDAIRCPFEIVIEQNGHS